MSMPNFLMIGAAKSGTSSLYAYLRQHPQLFLSEVRECEFFALEGQTPNFAGPGDQIAYRRYITTLDRYQALFAGAAHREAVGECSDLYLYSAAAARRIRDYIPDVKLIVMLRNPVDRAFSHYRQFVRDGREPLRTFEEALQAEETRIVNGWHPHWYLKARGLYSGQIKAYLELFPRERLAIHLYDDFQANPVAVLRDLFSFLGVDPTFVPDMSLRYNISGTPRSRLLHAVLARPMAVKDIFKPLIPARVRHRLRAKLMNRNIIPERARIAQETRNALASFYREDLLMLQSLIGRDLSPWLAA
jgi:sulfotransferase family protein